MAFFLISRVAKGYQHHQKPDVRARLKMIKIAEKVNSKVDDGYPHVKSKGSQGNLILATDNLRNSSNPVLIISFPANSTFIDI